MSLDLELSGIPKRSYKSQKERQRDGDGAKQTLQQRYAETKAAAEHFHILQIGLTFVNEDEQSGQSAA